MNKVLSAISGLLAAGIMLIWCIGMVHSWRAHSAFDFWCSLAPPWGFYRGLESFSH